MSNRYSAEHARKLVGRCRNLDDARFLIENSALLGPLHALLASQNGNAVPPATLRHTLEHETAIEVSDEDVIRCRDWLGAIGASEPDRTDKTSE